MKNIKLLILFLIPLFVFGQVTDTTNIVKQPEYITNGAFQKEHNQQKEKAYIYPEILEKDIVWSRTVWRSIDLRQKINHHFYYPAVKKQAQLNPDNMALIDVIMEVLQSQAKSELEDPSSIGVCNICNGTGEIIENGVLGQSVIDCSSCNATGKSKRLDCFDVPLTSTPGNEFRYGLMSAKEILSIGSETPEEKNIQVQDEFGNIVDSVDQFNNPVMFSTVVEEWDRTNVTEWLVKEEWYFDKKRSKMQVRIIGLCPVAEDFYDDKSGTIFPRSELFWIYFPDFRDVLVKTKVSNFTKNNAQERSYLGILEKRMFGSLITMESNIMNRQISDYMIGLDALLESERIKQEIFNIEHDMWEY